MQATQASVLEQAVRRTWKIPCASIEAAEGTWGDVTRPYASPPEPVRRPGPTEFAVGDRVTFDDGKGGALVGEAAKINRRTVMIVTDNQQSWRVDFPLLRHVFEAWQRVGDDAADHCPHNGSSDSAASKSMSVMSTNAPLTDEQFDRLQSYLETHAPAGMNVEWIDGYFAALICGPDMVLPSEYLPHILGEEFEFGDTEQAGDVIGLLMQHWNTIAGELLRTLSEPHVYLPVLLEDSEGAARANDWAKGFMRGVQMRPDSWRELLYSEERGGSAIPIMMLAHEDDPDPAMRPPSMDGEKRQEVIIEMIAGLTRIYRYFEPQRRSPVRTSTIAPVRREGRKVGRNEPCPCGSGRKYKHCCASSLH